MSLFAVENAEYWRKKRELQQNKLSSAKVMSGDHGNEAHLEAAKQRQPFLSARPGVALIVRHESTIASQRIGQFVFSINI